MRLTWKKSPAGRFSRQPDGTQLSVDGVRAGSVIPAVQTVSGWLWMWSAPTNEKLGIEHRNTYAEPVGTIDEAKAALKSYVLEQMKAKEK